MFKIGQIMIKLIHWILADIKFLLKRPRDYTQTKITRVIKSFHFNFNASEILVIPIIPFLYVFLYIYCCYCRNLTKTIDVGLGPEPLINNVYHKRALIQFGYTAETFAYTDNFISSEYDVNLASKKWSMLRKQLFLFFRAVRHYKAMFIYFNGGCLFSSPFLKKVEPQLYKAAGMKIVVMPFGSDVQVMVRSRNLYFRHTFALDFPHLNPQYKVVASNVDRWCQHADWVLSGCEWVDYMPYWSSLQLAHFSIDTEQWKPQRYSAEVDLSQPLRILHAPNHKMVKGTQAFLKAINELKQEEGLNIELVLLRGVPNTKIKDTIESVDLVADQFVIGWYAMFALEAMSLGKPVLCYLRKDLLELYTKAGLIEPDEIPLINTDLLDIKNTVRWTYQNRHQLPRIGQQGREFVLKHHSLPAKGKEFDDILKCIGVYPSRPAQQMPGLNSDNRTLNQSVNSTTSDKKELVGVHH